MANSILTPTAVTREALRILHQKLNFVGNINRQYDASYAKSGAKIGNDLKIKLPNQYTVRTGAVLNVQNTQETSTTLTVSTQKGVDVNFTSEELTMDLDSFSSQVLDPAMAVLAANIESDALSMYKDVWNQVGDVGSAITLTDLLNGRKILNDNLAPMDRTRTGILNTRDNADLVSANSSLFNPATTISDQYKEGMIGRTAGFNFYENTLLPVHTSGTDDSTGDYLTNDATAQTGSTLTVDTGTGTFKQGDVITIDGVFRVHPETKVSTGVLQQFVITADVAANATSISISPAIVASGAKQNVSNGAANNKAITKVESFDDAVGTGGVGASGDYGVSLLFHRDAFTFATADLVMPRGVDFAAREVLDSLSMRIVRQYDINNDQFPCRIDVLYGYKAIRPELACRLAFN